MISEELLQSFIAEASDLLDDAEPSLVEYPRHEDIEDRTEIVNRVFRHFHSIKGSAGFVGLHDIARLTHEAETLLEQYRKTPERIIPQEDINLLCRTVDLLRAIFANGGESSDAEGHDLGQSALIQEIVAATKSAKAIAAAGWPDAPPDIPEAGKTHLFDPQEIGEALASAGIEKEAAQPADGGKSAKEGKKKRSPQQAKGRGKTKIKPKAEPDPAADPSVSVTTAQGPDPKGVTRTRRPSNDTARIIKGSQMARRDKLSTSDFAMKYVTEANELLEQIEQSLLQAEQHPEESGDAIQEALRCLHSFKGNSGFMNLIDLERLSHRMESEVETHIGRTLGLDSQTFDALLQMIDVLRQGVNDFSMGGSGEIPETDAYISMMDEFSAGRLGKQYLRPPTAVFSKTEPDEPAAEADEGSRNKADDTPAKESAPSPTAAPTPTPTPPQPPPASAPGGASARRPRENETRQIGKPMRQTSDTTRMVLRGNTSRQVNLADLPKAESIVITTDPQADEAPRRTGTDSTSVINPAVVAVASAPAVPAPSSKSPDSRVVTRQMVNDTQKVRKTSDTDTPVGKKPSDTSQKRRSGEQLASRNDIRVDLRKLDSMLDLVGELIIAEAMVTRHPIVWNAENESLERAVHQLRRVASSLQDMATSVRMIPLAPTFRRMTRLVYDLSVKAGKQVDLVLLGEDTEVDRTVIERISDPMVHIIRNAIDHGIEAPEERRRLGKPETGRLTIEGHHEGGEVWIVITDDGRGLDRNAILSRALTRGLIQGDGGDLTDREIYHFIFEPGFSTATKVTDISGRGFGMDVVKKNIEKLSGRIDIQTRPGEGTAVVMRIPLTLAIIDGMLVSSGENRYIIPLLSIRESLRPKMEQIVTTPDGQEVLKLRGELIPIVKLDETFSRVHSSKTLMDGILMIVEGEDGDVVALFADELIGQQETVIKGLTGWLKKSRGVSGCAILGDGEVGLILDIGAIVRIIRERSAGLVKA